MSDTTKTFLLWSARFEREDGVARSFKYRKQNAEIDSTTTLE